MFLSLADNALDSIQYGLRSYKQFLSLPNKHLDNNPTHLKVAILMIHNGVELVLKHYLSSLNELLIYDLKDDKNKELFFNAYSIILDKSPLTLERYFLEENISMKTLDYSELIKIFNHIHKPTNKEFWCIKKLGEYRNQVTHYGINLQNDYYGVLQSLHGSLELILEGKLSKTLPADKWNPLANTFDSLFLQSEEQYINEWANNNLHIFTLISTATEEWLNSPSTISTLSQNTLTFSWSPPSDPIYQEFYISTSNKQTYPFYLIKVPFLNVTFFADDEDWRGPIYFLIDHNINKPKQSIPQIYFFKEPLKYANYEYCDIDFWKDSSYKSIRKTMHLNKENFQYCLSETLNHFISK